MERTDPEVPRWCRCTGVKWRGLILRSKDSVGGTKGRVEGDCSWRSQIVVPVQRGEWRGTDLEVPR